MNLYRSLLLSVIVLGAIACGNEKKKDEKEIGKSESQSPLITVDTLVLKKRTFQKQIVCNGKLRAVFKSDLSFDGTGVITAINGSNGGYVKKGEVLATLDMKEAQVELEKSYRAMEKANIDLQDKLIGQGYSADTTGIPTAILRNVKIIPFINDEKTFYGDVTEINPLIDEHGQVKIRARVRNADRYLMEGMNVKIILEREIKNSFVVPKDAVVLRDGFQVMFCYREGKAVWTYVDVVMSNIDSHVIKGSEKKQTVISEEDVVITSNNLNLADGTDVTPNNRR